MFVRTSVADPDPYVFGPPGSGSVSQRYGSGSFHHQAKIVRKTLKKFFVGSLKVSDENSRIRIQDPGSLVRGVDPDPDPYQNSGTGVPDSFSSATSCSRPRLFLGKGDSGSRVKEEEEEDEKESVPGPYSAVLRSSSERAKVRPSTGLECFPISVTVFLLCIQKMCHAQSKATKK